MKTNHFYPQTHRLLALLGLAAGLLLLFLLLPGRAAPAQADGNIILVPDNYASIQAAIDAARDGDEIRVVDGSYFERLVITKSLNISGGWEADFSGQTENYSIVDAAQGGRALTVYAAAVTPTVVISNFTFIHGDATGLGGVITPTVPNSPFTTTVAAAGSAGALTAASPVDLRGAWQKLAAQGQFPGGQAALDEALARLDGLVATASQPPEISAAGDIGVAGSGDEIDCGGGVYVQGAQLKLVKVDVARNTASRTGAGAGGGLCAVEVPVNGLVLEQVRTSHNTASQTGAGYGGGLFFNTGQPVSGALSLENVAIRENVAAAANTGYGGGAFIANAPGAQAHLAVWTQNTATSGGLNGYGGGLYLLDSANVTLELVAFQLNNANTNLVVANPTTDWLVGMGGAIYASNTPHLTVVSGANEGETSIFVGNVAALKGLGRGGGLYTENIAAGLRVEGVTFLGNWGAVYPAGQGETVGGGAIYLGNSPQAQLLNNTFNTNMAGVFSLEDFKLVGGAVDVDVSDHVLVSGNTFRENAGGTSAAGGNATGGALSVSYSDAVTVTNNIFTGNVADLGPSGGLGGALHVRTSNDTLIQHNTFERNRAGTGAGIGGALTLDVADAAGQDSWGNPGLAGWGETGLITPQGLTDKLNNRVTITANTFRDNTVAVDLRGSQILLGGAVAFQSVNGVTLTNNLIAGNSARTGAGLALLGWDVNKVPHDAVREALIVNNTLVSNSGETGVYMEMWLTPITLTNNIVVSHTVGIHANGNPKLGGMTAGVNYTVYNSNGVNSEVDNNDSTLIESHAITAPVAFVNFLGGDYHLQFTSAARDAADPDGVPPAPATDIEGTARPFGPRVDIGAYEWHGSSNQYYLPLLTKITCPDYSGWAVGAVHDGYGMIIHTTDGGCTWTRQGSAAKILTGELNGVAAVDAQTAWVTGANGVILHTTNGGASWQRQLLPAGVPANAQVGHIAAVNKDVLWTAACAPGGGASYILRTADGGTHWLKMAEFNDFKPGCLSRLGVLDAQTAWAVGGRSTGAATEVEPTAGQDGVIFRTTNGGQDWTLQLETTYTLIDAAPVSADVVWVVGKADTAFRTTDGGANWQQIDSGTAFIDINRVITTDGNTVWLTGDRSVLQRTTNGLAAPGEVTWHSYDNKVPVSGLYLMTLAFGEAQNGWLINTGGEGTESTRGYVFRTGDGGNSWYAQSIPENHGFWNMAMVKN